MRRGTNVAERVVLNIGRLSPGAADYYLGEVATSAEDYYTGKGESDGRWVGSLADRLGLSGAVTPDQFRAILDGRHPHTGEQLVPPRARRCHVHLPAPGQASLFDDDTFDVPRTAVRLRMSTRHVRRLLAAGRRPGDASGADTLLVGQRVNRPGHKGPSAWSVPRVEVERFESARRAAKARPGYDLTLRPPKSVSILWALAPETERNAIRAAHREAVDATIDYIEGHALYARKADKTRGRIETDGLVGAAFDHRTSRAGDPLLHTHVVCANVTFTADNTWRAVDARALYEHARAAGFMYQMQLRHAMGRELGVRFGTARNGWAEVDGVPAAVIRAFSKRRDEIEEMVAESGYTSARAHQAATLASRAAKEYGVDPKTLEKRWQSEAAALGFGEAEVAGCFHQERQAEVVSGEALLDELGGPAGLTRQASTFSRRDVIQAITEKVAVNSTAVDVEALADEFLASSRVQPLAPDGTSELVWRRDGSRTRSDDLARFSTPELLGQERRLLSWATDGFGVPVPTAMDADIDAALINRPGLSDEQVAMVRAVCGPAPAIQSVAGRPGAGKTFATAACVDAFTASGVPVVGAALSATAAAELEHATQMSDRTGRPATTIARLLIDLDRGGLPAGAAVFIDEASMVGTRDLGRLAEHAAGAGGCLKLIGDPDQHGPVETGGLFRALATAEGNMTVHLVENNRQHDPEERAAVDEFRQGLVESALSRYDAAGRVVRSATAAESYDRMVADWFEGLRDGVDDPMIAGPNSVRHALNRRARTVLKAQGELGDEMLVVGGREFCVGDWVVTRKNAPRLRSADHGTSVKNGSAGRVVDLDVEAGSLAVEFDIEGRIQLPADYLDAGWVEHGYARTTYGVQGGTLQRALYYAGDETSFEEGYVALTRAAEQTLVYIVDGTVMRDEDAWHDAHEAEVTGLEKVCEALERRRSRTLAHEADPLAADSREAFGGWTLRQLADERERLEVVLSAAPRSVDNALLATNRQRDALVTRHHSWERKLSLKGHVHHANRNPRSETRPVAASDAVAHQELGKLDRAIRAADARLNDLRAQRRERHEFLDDHAGEVRRLELVGRAEAARALQIRIAGRRDPGIATEPRTSVAPCRPLTRQALTAAAERAAVHRDRGDAASRASAQVPASPAERRSYERVALALRVARAVEPRAEPDVAVLDLGD